MSEVSLEQAVNYYGVTLPEIHRVGNEIRMRCFLACGRKDETGDRALSIQAEHPAKIWRCHQYGCGRGGNLISLCDFLKPGQHADGKPRGERFKAIIADLLAMSRNEPAPARSQPDVQQAAESPSESKLKPRINPPLVRCDNERARALVNLDEKFIVDVAQMSPRASSYFRSRPFLTPEVCRKWRMGYLPRDAGGERSGGTVRGKIVYPMLSETGEVLTWFGRDPEYESKHHAWITGGKQDREPEKFHFVKGFHRGVELFGQHGSRLREPAYRDRLRETGLIVVEGPNDVIALDCLSPSQIRCGFLSLFAIAPPFPSRACFSKAGQAAPELLLYLSNSRRTFFRSQRLRTAPPYVWFPGGRKYRNVVKIPAQAGPRDSVLRMNFRLLLFGRLLRTTAPFRRRGKRRHVHPATVSYLRRQHQHALALAEVFRAQRRNDAQHVTAG